MTRADKKILILGSYPITKPRHGGQKRVQAVVQEYQKHFKSVKFVAVFSRWANPDFARSDIPVSHQTDREIKEIARLEDVICGEAIFNEPKVKKQVTKLLQAYRPDVIQIEQVYSYLGLKPLLKELGMSPALVFDTHNVESLMKRSIYRDAGYKRADIDSFMVKIEEIERELVNAATLTIAVSPGDQDAYKAMGARNVILARNGIYPNLGDSKSRREWDKHFTERRINHKILYVSSAHLPNWTGFLEMVGDGFGFMPPDSRIVFAGGLADYLTTRHVFPATPGGATFWCRSEGFGLLSEKRLGGLIIACDAMILPVTTGGGSNLKTAEALLSGKPIIATSFAFRAYEKFMSLPTVTIADNPADFRAAIVKAMSSAPAVLSQQERELLKEVTWPHCLAELITEVGAL
jgi:hypothetical protein